MAAFRPLCRLLLAVAAVALGAACHRLPALDHYTSIHMDTVVEVTITGVAERRARGLAQEVFALFDQVEREMSSFRDDSTVSAIGHAAPAWVAISPDLAAVLREALRVAALSGGGFDPTIGAVTRLWGFGEEGGHRPETQALQAALATVGYPHLALEQGRARLVYPKSGLDLGGIAKGYAVDRAAELLARAGVGGAIVNAGGDIRVLGHRPDGHPWHIGIQHPRDPEKLFTTLEVTDTAVVTSGDYERYFIEDGVRYHHILDPATGEPARACQSVTVVTKSAMTGDALATAAFVLGPERGLALLQQAGAAAAIFVAADGTVVRFPAEP
ncbi:MAG: thiamine biosynthesis protein ApbE [Nitrospirae bacterium CG18_big_fil_WC_8_21_14_2_50_70_55]|nr:FAD:protein FMN transferase [Deltaproteobacteria bacterium]OIP64959.1 MAG: hypothetical protein AUK30_05645 [Nitrospirae bacterium CG2_30_70_394]PIQ07025.1 MAG: thiamine biosynthesis protein ApbE [Nitrospirae bacterium CG18_big_fil_WC_8_21_14_2_50_70_55]PIU79892.1 MAG: FAD:protein FMN transferase [Nitrospirae bacterium CG06_land_8_20_14_3_00_70_43]PIW82809.1 MAG: FAD:protein FMN transferase [Nitrospirae bacterium CG_4_8_14_3_um_filter_70_85]PIX84220.1 MAG: FAD:protein FMN transferase [Nitro